MSRAAAEWLDPRCGRDGHPAFARAAGAARRHANHLARDLRVQRADEALDALRCGEAVGVDVATIDGRPFLNSAGFGAYPEMVATTDRLRHRIGRWPARLVAFVKTLVEAEPLEVTLNGERRSVWMGFAGNCRHEPPGLAPSWRSRLDDGRLDVRLLAADVPRSRVRLLAAALTGRRAPPRISSAACPRCASSAGVDGCGSPATASTSKATRRSRSRSATRGSSSTPVTSRARCRRAATEPACRHNPDP
jgi:hypothetical protein